MNDELKTTARWAASLADELRRALNAASEGAPRSEETRLVAIAVTHLETAQLFLEKVAP